MLLRTLSLAGFKSFADRTRLEFHSGVNVVVGPNGSGKSNLLDAMAWVMGTQATTVLRTEKMDDLIFAGTATRPRLGRAEVTLTFDNRDRFLPLDLDEVSMTRRLYRDGTSEYLLNGTQCRLLDLHEILADGGVGRHQHVLVGQGQIGDILNARPDEHRAVIEEAAGITKHRGRRDRSVRRLQQTDLDIARLTDILDEQRKRLRPLKRQANAAERHDSVRDEARALHLWLGGEALRGLEARRGAATAERGDLEAGLDRAGAELATLESSLEGLRTSATRVGRELERDTAAAARLETITERFRSVASVAGERRSALERRAAGAAERRRDLEIEESDLVADIEQSTADQDAARHQLASVESEYTALDDEERALAEQVGLTAEGLVANLRGDLRALETATERDRREAGSLQMRRDLVREQLAADGADRRELVGKIESLDTEIAPAQAAYEKATKARVAAQVRWEDGERQQRDAELDLEKASARREAMAAALAGEGDPQAMETARGAAGVVGAVVEQLDVPYELAPAVDAALGPWSDALAACDRASVPEIASLLKADGLGGVAVAAPGAGVPAADATEVAREWGVDTLVGRLGTGRDERLATALLGDVVLVEHWSAAWDLVDRYPTLRAVTPEGDLVSASGMYLGQPDGVGPAALEAVSVVVEQAEVALARAVSSATTAHRAFEASRERERETLEALEALEARLAGQTEALALIDRVRGEHDAELLRLDRRLEAIQAEERARSERVEELRARLSELEGDAKSGQRAWERLKERRAEVTARKAESRKARDRLAGEVAGAAERRTLLETRLGRVRAALASVGEEKLDTAVVERLGAVEERARLAADVCRGHIASLRERQRILRERTGEADAALAQALERRAELRDTADTAKSRLAALAVELTEVEVRTEAAAEALRRDADAGETAALAAPRPELPADVDAREHLETLEARLRRMGPINPLAAEEYRVLAEQVALLEAQLGDLEATRAELRKVIAALDGKMAALFVEAFDDIARMFEENFALVFPGGRGRLVLTDPQRPLETGVEIHAQPLGKKVGRLSLLSGGERSLAALAFLFAVFRARPSPFYVLDEVEAALDDANLRRFLLLVETLRRSAQLVIITHQQQTMEAADILYGVTMEPGESSLVVAKRFSESVA